MRDQRDALLMTGTANVSDALRSLGKAFQAMDAGIRPLAPDMRLAGPAFTVRCFPGATWAMEKSLQLASPGDVLVVDGAGASDAILMGGLMSTSAQSRGIEGAVLDAAVRDVDHIIELGFPVFSRHICPRAGTFDEIGEWQTTICCGRLPVRPGDWILADRNGIVLVPIEMLDRVVDRALQIHHREDALAAHLRTGKSLSESAAAVAAAGNGGQH
jgi:regulator of RNase E activity RraA